MNDNKMKIVIILGSVSKNSLTRKAAYVIAKELEKGSGITVEIIDPRDFKLPIPGSGEHTDDKSRLQEIVANANGAILATPEYNGSFSSIIKMMIENLSYPSELFGKPIGLLGVATGDMGALKSIEALRGVCAYIGGIALPNAVSISHAKEHFDSDGNCVNEKTTRRLKRLADDLIKFIESYN